MKKYYHASPKRFKIGKILGGAIELKANFQSSIKGMVFLTTSPYPHYTIYGKFERLHIYEVQPIGKVFRGYFEDLYVHQAEIVKYIGVASKSKSQGLSKCVSSIGIDKKKSHNTNKLPYKRYRALIFENAEVNFCKRKKIEDIQSVNLDKLHSIISSKGFQYYVIYDYWQEKEIENTLENEKE